MITLITMGQGNPIALKRTLESFKGFVNEIIYGDLLIFEEDRKIIETYKSEYNLRIVLFEFNYIFKDGFSAILNALADHATNDWVLYMNTSEVIDESYGTVQQALETFELTSGMHNCYHFIHATEKHRWVRMYRKRELRWNGLIHEELNGALLNYNIPIFMMADTEKDMENSFKAKVYNDIKELVYFNQYLRLVDEPESIGVTNEGWVKYAKDSYDHIKSRMQAKGARYDAFKEGDFNKYLADIFTNPSFVEEVFESSKILNFQGVRRDIL